eukprot:364339-Chlamydomonas_euryale.AAC.5
MTQLGPDQLVPERPAPSLSKGKPPAGTRRLSRPKLPPERSPSHVAFLRRVRRLDHILVPRLGKMPSSETHLAVCFKAVSASCRGLHFSWPMQHSR